MGIRRCRMGNQLYSHRPILCPPNHHRLQRSRTPYCQRVLQPELCTQRRLEFSRPHPLQRYSHRNHNIHPRPNQLVTWLPTTATATTPLATPAALVPLARSSSRKHHRLHPPSSGQTSPTRTTPARRNTAPPRASSPKNQGSPTRASSPTSQSHQHNHTGRQ